MRIGFLFHKLAMAFALTLPGGLASACLSFECRPTDVTCNPGALLLYLNVEPDCNFTQSLNFDALQQEAFIKTSNPDANEGSPAAMAFDCETQTLVLGLRSEASNATGVNGDQSDNSAGNAGAVYVFRFQNGEWSQEAYLKASNTETNDEFGLSVSISGDALVVGAAFEDSGATGVDGNQSDNSAGNSGAAYVFRRDSQDTWSQEAYLKSSNNELNDTFGRNVAISGDLIAVGAPQEDSSASGINGNQSDNSAGNAGAVYVFRRANQIWQQEAYVKASSPDGGDRFGEKLALDGETLVVGTILEDGNTSGIGGDSGNNLAVDSGAAYVFKAMDRIWSQQAYIKASNAEAGDEFGYAVALRGDLLAVSSREEASGASGVGGIQTDNSAAAAGAVYLFRRSADTWTQEAYVKASNTEGNDEFGESVAVGNESIAVGAARERGGATGIGGDDTDNSAAVSGAAYLFRRDDDGVWSQAAYMKASNTQTGDRFGNNVAMSGNGLAVYANGEDSPSAGINGSQADGGSNTGAIYFFR